MFGECVWTIANREGGLQRFVGSFLDHRKACKRRAEVRSVRFDHRKACRRLAGVQNEPFDHPKACIRFAYVRSVF